MKKLLLACMLLFSASAMAQNFELTSPGGSYKVELFNVDGESTYRISYNDYVVVLDSKLGVEVGKQYLDGTTLTKEITSSSKDSSWEPLYGERAVIRDCYNSKTFELRSVSNPRTYIHVEFRAYDEGIAFRYVFPGDNYLHITDEYTTFTLPEGTLAYFTQHSQAHCYLLPLKDWPSDSDRPLVCKLPNGGYVLLTEASMIDYVRSKFKLHQSKASTLACSMYGDVDRIAPYSTPWRVVMAADTPGELIENNDIILNLNPENEIEDTSWIKPGKMMRDGTLSTEGSKAVVDFCVEHNMQYMLLDAGWYGPEGSHLSDVTTVTLDPGRNKDAHSLDLPEVIAYAKSKGIGVVLYVNQRALYAQLDEMLETFKEWGVAGIKFGFVQVGSQYWTEWMHEAIKKCAEYELIVDTHDDYRPTGFARTYPNHLTQEGIRGNEEFPDANQNLMLPFTRFTQGPGDYTLCYYKRDWTGHDKPDTSNGFVNVRLLSTTATHQLAMAAVYYSPLQVLYWYDKPGDSQDEPELEFWDRCPTVWDDTKVLAGEIGEYVSIARRSGEEWFVGTMTNTSARDMSVALDFLEPGVKYTAKIFYDDPKSDLRTKVGIKEVKVTSKSVIEVEMLASGGHAMVISPR